VSHQLVKFSFWHRYLAARALKSRAWCFHKKYGTWFQRHSEPTHMTAEYEDGTYVYFDPSDSGWCQRVKEKFRFEYTFLEERSARGMLLCGSSFFS